MYYIGLTKGINRIIILLRDGLIEKGPWCTCRKSLHMGVADTTGYLSILALWRWRLPNESFRCQIVEVPGLGNLPSATLGNRRSCANSPVPCHLDRTSAGMCPPASPPTPRVWWRTPVEWHSNGLQQQISHPHVLGCLAFPFHSYFQVLNLWALGSAPQQTTWNQNPCLSCSSKGSILRW